MKNYRYRYRIGVIGCCVVLVEALTGHAQLVTGKVPVGNLGHELYYESQGSGEPVVLIHGLTLDLREWDAQANALAERYQVIRYDVTGHGRSSGLSSSLPNASVRDWEYLRDLLDVLDVDKAHIVGLSMGGGIAINFALQYPDRVQTLTPIDAKLGGYNVPSELGDRFSSYLNVSRTQGVQAALSLWSADPLFAPANADPDVRAKLEQLVVEGHGSLGAGAMFQWPNILKPAELSPPARNRLNEIDVPTLVMIGELDLIDFQNQADILDHDIPDSTKLMVPNAGHMSDMEQPDFVNAALLDFFAAHPMFQSLPGDFNEDGLLDALDIELLSAEFRAGTNHATFDITSDGVVDDDDRQYWVSTVRRTWFGDANMDQLFDSADLVEVLAIGEYEDGIDANSLWAEGDWDGNADFDSSDFVRALADGGYEAGPRGPIAAVPEPSSLIIVVLSIVTTCRRSAVRYARRRRGGKSCSQVRDSKMKVPQ